MKVMSSQSGHGHTQGHIDWDLMPLSWGWSLTEDWGLRTGDWGVWSKDREEGRPGISYSGQGHIAPSQLKLFTISRFCRDRQREREEMTGRKVAECVVWREVGGRHQDIKAGPGFIIPLLRNLVEIDQRDDHHLVSMLPGCLQRTSDLGLRHKYKSSPVNLISPMLSRYLPDQAQSGQAVTTNHYLSSTSLWAPK